MARSTDGECRTGIDAASVAKAVSEEDETAKPRTERAGVKEEYDGGSATDLMMMHEAHMQDERQLPMRFGANAEATSMRLKGENA